MRRFVERIEREPPAGIRDCAYRVALLMGEPLERAPELLPERLGLGRLPLVELHAVAEGEAREEVRAVDVHRLGETARGEKRAKALHVAVDPVAIERHAQPIGRDVLAAERGPERRERPAQCAARPLVIRVRPEQPGEPVAPLGVAGYGEVRKERDRLARVGLDRLSVALDTRRAEEEHAQARLGRHGPQAGGWGFPAQAAGRNDFRTGVDQHDARTGGKCMLSGSGGRV